MASKPRCLMLACVIQFLTTIDLTYGTSMVLNNGIAAIPEDLDEGILELNIIDTTITNLTGYSLINLTNLHTLEISKNKLLQYIDTSIFQGLVSLKKLTISENPQLISIDKLHEDALSQLVTLDIDDNPLQFLSMELVQGAHNLEYLRIRKNEISSPPLVNNLLNLRTLYLGHNRISVIARGYLFGLRITHLKLYWNKLTAIPDLASVSQTLVYLSLRGNPVNHFEDGIFSNFPVLQELDLRNTWHFKISDLARATDGLPSLWLLSIVGTGEYQGSIDDETLKRMPKLKVINLNDNDIVVFPNFYLNKAITTIYMRYTAITHFTGDELFGLDNLDLLEVDGSLEKFPNLVYARNLRTLQLFYNSHMGNVPLSALAAVPGLTKLELTETNLTEFPCIACLRHTLKSLYLDYNSLTVIPESRLYDDILCQCNNKEVTDQTNVIETLVLSYNPGIQQLNRTFMLLFTKLTNIEIVNIGLTDLPYLAHLGNTLYLLQAGRNHIQHIPEDYFSNMPYLTHLNFRYNNLKVFPFFANRMGITHLGLEYNEITHVVTKDITNLPYLFAFNLEGNKLKVFEVVYRSPHLAYFYLSHNPFPMSLNSSLPVRDWYYYLTYVYFYGNRLLCTKDAICWLKSENLRKTRNVVVYLSEKPCYRPARFVGMKWSSITKAMACAENNVLADEYICTDTFGSVGPCPSFDATNNICEPPCCRQSDYGGACITRIASMYVQVSRASCCTSFVEKTVSVTHVGEWSRYTADTASHCAKYCHYGRQCQAFIFTSEGQDCLLLYDAKLTYNMSP